MHNCLVKMKNGDEYCSPLFLFRPEDGYLRLFGVEEKLYFSDMESAIDTSQRTRLGVIEDVDLIERAIQEGYDPNETYHWEEDNDWEWTSWDSSEIWKRPTRD